MGHQRQEVKGAQDNHPENVDIAPIEGVGELYIRDLLCLLPNWPKHRALHLSPVNRATTVATGDVAAKLAANRFRQAVIASRA